MKLPNIERDKHFTVISLDNLTVWFSYDTVIAFEINGRKVVRKNTRGPTTGGHLNWIDGGDKKNRVDSEEFGRLWTELVNK